MTPKRPRDPNQLAKSIINTATVKAMRSDGMGPPSPRLSKSVVRPSTAPQRTEGRGERRKLCAALLTFSLFRSALPRGERLTAAEPISWSRA
jgi:hypothetical protein